MSQKILLFVYFVGISQAIFIDPNKNLKKETYGNEEAKVFQMLNVYHPPQSHIHYKYESHTYPKYDFQYAVSDKKTGDHKQHRESRDGDCVRGEYSLVEPDGSVRKVEYNADSHNGFNAIVIKGVQKHGDHAYSMFDHTRHFYPIGHNIKINHYFPNKDDNKNNKSNLEKELQPSPVQEEQDIKNEDDNMVAIDAGDKVMILKPIEETEINEVNDASKVNTEETVIETSPSPSSEPTLSDNENKTEVETVPLKATVESNGELSEKDLNSIKNEHNDSEVASSYYRSRIYYMY